MTLPERGAGLLRGTVAYRAGIAFAALLLLASTLWLRFRGVGISSLWLDDAWVGVGARFPTLGDTVRAGLTSPGFSLLYRGWAAVFGSGATAAQMLALTFALVTPLALFLAAVERGVPAVAALFGAGLLATAPNHISMSTRLKQYTAEAFVATLVLWAAWRVIDRPNSWGRWLAFTAVAIGAGLLSGTGAVFSGTALAVCVASALLTRPRQLRFAAAATVGWGLVVVPWTLLVMRPNANSEVLANSWRGYFLDGPGFAGGLAARGIAVAHGFQWLPWTIVVLSLAFAAGFVLIRRPWVGLLLVLPTLVAVGLAAATLVPIGTNRTDIYLYPSYALLVSVALGDLARLRHLGKVIAVLAVVGFATITFRALEHPEASAYPEEDVAPLVHYVERQRRAGDEIVVYPMTGYAYGFATRYQITRRPDRYAAPGWAVRVNGPLINVLPTDIRAWSDSLDRVTARQPPRVWLIGSHLKSDWLFLPAMLEARGYRSTWSRMKPTSPGHDSGLVLFIRGRPPNPGVAS